MIHTLAWHAVCILFHRLRGSRVLLAGLGGLGAEVAKNLILAGVKGLTLLDHEQVHTLKLCTQNHAQGLSFLSSLVHTVTYRVNFGFNWSLKVFVLSYQLNICVIHS